MAVKPAVSADSSPSILLFIKESGNLWAMKIIVLSQKKHHVSLLPTSRPRPISPSECGMLCRRRRKRGYHVLFPDRIQP
jgi:hypothetical protein